MPGQALRVRIDDLRFGQIAAQNEHVRPARQTVQPLAGDRIPADGDDLPLRLQAVAQRRPVEIRYSQPWAACRSRG